MPTPMPKPLPKTRFHAATTKAKVNAKVKVKVKAKVKSKSKPKPKPYLASIPIQAKFLQSRPWPQKCGHADDLFLPINQSIIMSR